jgi:hypothetical protein
LVDFTNPFKSIIESEGKLKGIFLQWYGSGSLCSLGERDGESDTGTKSLEVFRNTFEWNTVCLFPDILFYLAKGR